MPAPTEESLRRLLEARARQLRAEIALGIEAERALAADPNDVFDRKDEADLRALAEVGEGEVSRDLDELRQIDAALRRLDQGRYGRCAHCGEPIDPERLAALPTPFAARRASERRSRRPCPRRTADVPPLIGVNTRWCATPKFQVASRFFHPPKGRPVKTDADLKRDVMAELAWDPAIHATAVGVAVRDGVVTLTGHLDSYAGRPRRESRQVQVGHQAVAHVVDQGASKPSARHTAQSLRM